MALMEYVSPTGLSLRTLTCVVCCLLTCVKPGQSFKCNGAMCGYGTEQSCRTKMWCSCQSQFYSVRTNKINNQLVQFCLEICDVKTCPRDYQCVGNGQNPHKLCTCVYGYKRSANGECVVSCTFLNCEEKGRPCYKRPHGDVCGPTCAAGFRPNFNGGCKDVNECFVGSPCANNAHSKCWNTHGSYRCNCVKGYGKSSNSDLCEDIDECAVKTTCDDKQNTICVNSPAGSFQCECLDGYSRSDNDECKDIDECLNKTECDDKQNTICVNTPGSFQCDCIQGYNRSTSNKPCEDIDECLHKGTCDEYNNTACVNTPGSFNCECLQGYTSDNDTSCQDIDECFDKANCDDKQNTLCVNTPGSSQCDCITGYTRPTDNKPCEDVDECLHEGICDEYNNTGCVNTPGSFNCECLLGYTSDNKTSCQVKITVAGLTSTNDGSSVGLYVGVTIGVLVLLGMVVVAIIVRRRRNSNKSHEGIAEFSSREPEHIENPTCTNVYDNVSLEHENVDLPNQKREEKTVSVEYSNGKISQNKLARNSSSISVEYSNNKILASTKRNGTQRPTIGTGGPEEQGVYNKGDILPHKNRPDKMTRSPNPIQAVNLNDAGVYNTLDAFSLNTTNTPKRHQQVPGELESQGIYSNPYEEHVLPNNIDNENMATFPNLVTGDTFHDHEAYNTLDAFNLNTQSKQKSDCRIVEDRDPYNKIL